MPRLVALYKRPEDTDAFDAHYRDVHTPIVSRYPNLRDVRLSKLAGVGGRAPPYYLMAEMVFDSAARPRRGTRLRGRRRERAGPAQLRRRRCHACSSRPTRPMPEPGSPVAADPSTLGFERIRYERDADAGVATVTINRPDVLNALDFPTLRELARAFEQASWDDVGGRGGA